MKPVLFLGGNGHCVARLEPAARALNELGSELVLEDARYPGFEGRPRVRDLEGFLDAVAERAHDVQPRAIYATGIGGLFLLALRARGELRDVPVILQGAVLWGLEHRLFARVMRGPLPAMLRLALRTPLARRRFRARHLADVDHRRAPGSEEAFFRGYAECAAFADFFRWLRPALLRDLERRLPAQPGALDRIEAWWGARDEVVGTAELDRTEAALGVRFPRRVWESWGHYPMLEDPLGWARELDDALA